MPVVIVCQERELLLWERKRNKEDCFFSLSRRTVQLPFSTFTRMPFLSIFPSTREGFFFFKKKIAGRFAFILIIHFHTLNLPGAGFTFFAHPSQNDEIQ